MLVKHTIDMSLLTLVIPGKVYESGCGRGAM